MFKKNSISKQLKSQPILAITSGEPAGIGPEIAIKAAWDVRLTIRSVLLGDAKFFIKIARTLNPKITFSVLSLQKFQKNGLPKFLQNNLIVIDCPVNFPIIPGVLDIRNERTVLQMLNIAIDNTLQKKFAAIVTAPIQKSTINDAGIFFTGHTEYFAQRTVAKQVVMMLVNDKRPPLRIALATTHLPLKAVPQAITFNKLNDILDIIHTELHDKFHIIQPHILVASLNPHGGENGYFGCEEIEVIIPAIIAAQSRNINVTGPYPADTLFQKKYLQHADCVLAMYHDQGLPVLKFASFGHSINITLGLPIIRTAVDHGTALDLAAKGLGNANHYSMTNAIKIAAQMAMIKNCI